MLFILLGKINSEMALRWRDDLVGHIELFEDVDLADAGFPSDWLGRDLWRSGAVPLDAIRSWQYRNKSLRYSVWNLQTENIFTPPFMISRRIFRPIFRSWSGSIIARLLCIGGIKRSGCLFHTSRACGSLTQAWSRIRKFYWQILLYIIYFRPCLHYKKLKNV